MLAYSTPGVYFEWLDTREPAIIPLRTDIAGFVGIASSGPVQVPVKIESMRQFSSIFGPHTPQGYLAYAVEGFFANGGRTCWVVRVADLTKTGVATADLLDPTGAAALQLAAISRVVNSRGESQVYPNPGSRGEQLTFSLTLTAQTRFSLVIRLDNAQEMWRDLSMDPNDPRYVEKVINDKRSGSRLISVTNLSGGRFPNNTPDPRSPELRGGVGRLTGGKDGLGSLSVGHLTGEGAAPDLRLGLSALEEIDEISMVAMPDIMPKDRITPKTKVRPPDCRILNQEPQPPPPSSGPLEFPRNFSDSEIAFLQATLIGHCERLKDRVAILDSLRDHLNSEQVIGWRRPTSGTPGLIDSTYGALYFPWVLVPDPLQLTGLLRTVPPSGHVAGIYARGDLRVGVHKPPANEELEAVKDVRVAVDDLAHGDLNNHGINVIRAQQGRGVRVSGARTIAPSDKPEWRYINVRRLLLMIEEAIDEQTQWTVFEPNNPDLWREVDRVARSFLDGLWRRGMLDGATAEEAYFVRCDETTNPADQTEAGRLICEIGVLPPWPAEFVVVRIGKTEGGTEILENERSE